MTSTEIARTIGTSVSRVRANIIGLIRDGFVIPFEHPKQHFYQLDLLNLDTLKFAELHYAERFLTVNKAFQNLLTILGAYFSFRLKKNLLLLVLFGSSVKEKEFKDVDLCLVLDKKTSELLKLSKEVLDGIQASYPAYTFSVDIFSEKEFRQKILEQDSLVINILRGIPLPLILSGAETIADFMGFAQRFTEYKLFLYSRRIGGSMVKAYTLLIKYEETRDAGLLDDAVKNLIFSLLVRRYIFPENTHEAEKTMKEKFPRLYKDIQRAHERRDSKQLFQLLLGMEGGSG